MRGLTGTIVWGCVAAGIGIGLFFLKHEVKEQEARLSNLNQEIRRNQEAIHVLKAEWAYLNDPARLRQLSERHLGLKPMQPSQIATLDVLPRELAPSGLAAAKPTAPPPPAVKTEPPKQSAPAPVVAKADAKSKVVAKAEPKPAHVLTAPPQPATAARRTIVIQSPALAASDLNSSGEPR